MTPAISSFVPPVAPQPAASSGNAGAPSGTPGFAQMLSRTQQSHDAAPTAEAPEAVEAKAAAAQAERGKAVKADKPARAEGERSPKTEEASAEDKTKEAASTQATDETDGPSPDPALADWLASLQLPTTPQATSAAPRGGDATRGDSADESMEAAAAVSGRGASSRQGPLAAAGKDRPDAAEAAREARELKTRQQAEPAEVASTAAHQSSELHAQDSVAHEPKPAQEPLAVGGPSAAAGAHAAHGPSRTAEPQQAPASVQVPTPAMSPEFPHALGVQVSVLATEGVQQAQLHLNPAEMGPISVQISLDGTQAQVNFAADSAATRQIIESGLPELAASLRDAGFTLSGGGVHSQSGGREQGDGGQRGERNTTVAGIENDVTARRVSTRISDSGVDVYA